MHRHHDKINNFIAKSFHIVSTIHTWTINISSYKIQFNFSLYIYTRSTFPYIYDLLLLFSFSFSSHQFIYFFYLSFYIRTKRVLEIRNILENRVMMMFEAMKDKTTTKRVKGRIHNSCNESQFLRKRLQLRENRKITQIFVYAGWYQFSELTS